MGTTSSVLSSSFSSRHSSYSLPLFTTNSTSSLLCCPPPLSSCLPPCSPSSALTSSKLEEIVLFLMPSYYISTHVTSRDIKLSQASWNLILSSKSHVFQKENNSLEFQEKYEGKCVNWFVDIFFERFFDIHPMARSLFMHNSLERSRKQITKVISLSLSQNKDSKKFMKLMKELAQNHCHRGVQAIEYGIMGNVLFYALRRCLGDEQYPQITDAAWKSVYSSMLRLIVPECVKYELEQRYKNQIYDEYRRDEYNRVAGTEDSFMERLGRMSPSSSLFRDLSSANGSSSHVENSFSLRPINQSPESAFFDIDGENNDITS